MTGIAEGIVPVLATPFLADGAVDEESFVRQVRYCVEAGVAGVAMFGLASECFKLSDAERDRLARLTVEAAGGEIPVVLSVTPQTWELAVEEGARFAAHGASALMVMPPFLFGPPVEAALAQVEAVARAVEIPVIVQYAPAQTNLRIEPARLLALAGECPNIEAVKVDAVPAGPMISRLSGPMKAYIGYLGTHLPEAVARGVDGCMPSAAFSRFFVETWRLLREDPPAGRRRHAAVLPLLEFMMQTVDLLLACEKRLLVRAGLFTTATCRRPCAAMDEGQEREFAILLGQAAPWLPEWTR